MAKLVKEGLASPAACVVSLFLARGLCSQNTSDSPAEKSTGTEDPRLMGASELQGLQRTKRSSGMLHTGERRVELFGERKGVKRNGIPSVHREN